MRIFIYEYTCNEYVTAGQADSLRQEGLAMLAALMEDFARIPGVEPWTLVNANFEFASSSGVWQHVAKDDEFVVFQDLARQSDFTLVIAPEFDNILLY